MLKMFGGGGSEHPLANPKEAKRMLDELPAPDAKALEELAGWHETPIYDRALLTAGAVITGPAVGEQADTTTVIEPGMTATVDAAGNILVRL